MVGQPGKRHAHIPTMRSRSAGDLMVFSLCSLPGAACRRVPIVAGRGTTATIALDRAGIPFTVHEYPHDPRHESYGLEASQALGIAPERVFKTLVAEVDGALVVGVVPVEGQLDLKALAAASGGKKAAMAQGGAGGGRCRRAARRPPPRGGTAGGPRGGHRRLGAELPHDVLQCRAARARD